MGKRKQCQHFRPYVKPNWKGIAIKSKSSMGGLDVYEFNNYKYCTSGEYLMAQMLTQAGVAFMPDVQFPIPPKKGTKNSRNYVPDFVFMKDEYLWTDSDGTEHIIHGIECKGAMRKCKKANALYKKYGINIIVVCEAEIDSFWQNGGQLPMVLYKKARKR